MSDPRIIASYRIETPLALEDAAESMAGEQSTGTYARVEGESDSLRARHLARVESIVELEPCDRPSLPGAATCFENGSLENGPVGGGRSRFQCGEVQISFPLANIGANLPTLFTTVAGNLFELRQLSGLRLLDVEFPAELSDSFLSPQFGIEGTRRLAKVEGRPLLGTIVKPSVGLPPQETAKLVEKLSATGIDFIKDDELMADPPHSPLKERVKLVMEVINRHADQTGHKIMVAFNVTDQLDQMLRHHDLVLEAGGTCIMASLNSIGLVGVEHLRRHSQLPIHGHRNGWGMWTRSPALGMDFRAYQKFWRLAGIDHLHVNGLQSKFAESDASVVDSIRACREPMWGGRQLMPVVSSGQWGGQAPETFRETKTVDLIYLAGGGIMAHPAGPAAGVAAIRQAWEAAMGGIELETCAQSHSELRQSIEFFGRMAHSQVSVK